MIFPTTTLAALLTVILGLVCWSSWANFYKVTRRWRFELFYYDFTWGVVLIALVAAFTLGSMNSQDLTFQDNFLLAGYRKEAWTWAAGVLANVGNLLLLASLVIAGMSVAFPVGLGFAIILTALLSFIMDTRSLGLLPFAGSVLVAIAVVLGILAHNWRLQDIQIAAQQAFIADPRTKAPPKAITPMRGSILALLGGIFIAASRPMLIEGTTGDNGVSPYGAALLFAAGVLASSLLFVPFFLNFPVQGKPEQVRRYFNGNKKQHILGILGGVLWGSGLVAFLVANEAAPSARVSTANTYALTQGVPVLATLWGLFAWREFKGASNRVQAFVLGMVVLLVAGIGVIAIAQRSIR